MLLLLKKKMNVKCLYMSGTLACLRTFGINVHAHPYYSCVFLTDSKTISDIVYVSNKLQ